MPKEKTNPNKIPATQADVEHAFQAGMKIGTDYTSTIILSILHDKEGYGGKRLKRVWNETEYLAGSVGKRIVHIEELEQVLEDEIGVKIVRESDPIIERLLAKYWRAEYTLNKEKASAGAGTPNGSKSNISSSILEHGERIVKNEKHGNSSQN